MKYRQNYLHENEERELFDVWIFAGAEQALVLGVIFVYVSHP